MKKPTELPVHFATWISIALGLAIGAVGISGARADEVRSSNVSCESGFWREVKMLATECVERRENGEECDSIQFLDDRSASFEIEGRVYRAEIFESEFSDGGDLNDVLIDSVDGCRFELVNIPAFGDLLEALASVRF